MPLRACVSLSFFVFHGLRAGKRSALTLDPDNRASVTPVLGITAAQWSEPWRSRYVVERAQTSRKRSHSSRAIFTKAQSLRAAALLNLA